MLLRTSNSNSFNTSNIYNKMRTLSDTAAKASITGECREMTDGLHHCSGKSGSQCPSQCPNRLAVEKVNRELIVAKLTALLTVTALMCAQHSLFLVARHSLFDAVVWKWNNCSQSVRHSSAHRLLFQRIWPLVEGLLSEHLPAILLLPLSLYGLKLLHSLNSKMDVQPLHSISKTRQTIPKLIVRSAEDVEILSQGTTIEMPAQDTSLARRQRQSINDSAVGIETREQLRVVLLFALLTSVAALQEGAVELVAALSPTFIEYSKREWLFVRLISHLLSLLFECFTLPLCLALSAHFRRYFCTLLCF